MPRCFIALGGNVGDVPAAFRAARGRLAAPAVGRVGARSRMFCTAPVGAHAGPAYLNAVLELQTELHPEALLEVLQQVERDAGRIRTGPWRPRPLDLDLLTYGDLIIQTDALTVPHPGCWQRRFVLDPWCDISPAYTPPGMGETIARMRDRLLPRPLCVAIAGRAAVLRDVFETLSALPELNLMELPEQAPPTGGAAQRPEPPGGGDSLPQSATEAAVIFTWGPSSHSGRCIDLAPIVRPVEFAANLAAAMTDSPIPLADPR